MSAARPSAVPPSPRDFHRAVVRWQKRHGRHDLPWQQTPSPYHVWLSEVMLQQTQVATVIPYYQRFIRRFPTLQQLANARLDTVLGLWSGLGYYARARNLHRAAKQIRDNGMPTTMAEWLTLPGVGRSTAAAIAVFTTRQRCAILDGNVKRLLARVAALPTPVNTPAGERELLAIAETLLPDKRSIRAYTQGLMDLGAGVCLRGKPKCEECPLADQCAARQRQQTDIFPRAVRRPRRPVKKTIMLLIRNDSHVLLERRPAAGVWGQLWSLPEGTDLPALLAEWTKKAPEAMTAAGETSFVHDFTHYRLMAHVKIYDCPSSAAPRRTPPQCRWMNRRALDRAGLPAPIKKLLRGVTMRNS